MRGEFDDTYAICFLFLYKSTSCSHSLELHSNEPEQHMLVQEIKEHRLQSVEYKIA